VTVYDIGNLAVFDARDVEQEEGVSIEDTLKARSAELTEGILRHLFDLPVQPPQPEIPGRIADLPKPQTPLPREKPLPAPKELTTWEKFAKTKGINKKKNSRMEYDETHDQWRPRFGYKKANDEMDVWAIPVKDGDDNKEDPWTTASKEKKDRINKNKKQQLRNVKTALKKAPGKRLDGTIDLSAAKAGVSGGSKAGTKKQKSHVDVTLELAQKSTASMGRFDKKRSYEPEIKLFKTHKDADKSSISAEKSSSMSIFNKLMGSKPGEKSGFDHKKAANMAVNPKSFKKGPGDGGQKRGGKGGKSNKRQKKR